jgi:chaperone required for assembly of F1-ATPase
MSSVVPIKRFYKAVRVGEGDGGWKVLLDGRPLKTPGGRALTVGSRALADAIAAEWEGQVEKIRPETMPTFRLLATGIDRVADRREDVITATLKYAETDLLCYRADMPSDLIELQEQRWQPLLDWARDELGAHLEVTSGIRPVDQPPEALDALRAAVSSYDDLGLTGLSSLAGVTGSLVLALALAQARIDAEEGGALALLDEQYQAERWGEDEQAREKRDRTRAEIAETIRFLNLIG